MAYPRQSTEISFFEFTRLLGSLFESPTQPGKNVERFERAAADFLKVRYALSFGSQRAGMYALLASLSPRGDDEIIVPAYTFFSVPACVVLAGFRPVFVDVDPVTWNLDPAKIAATISPKTRAIIVTHLNGCPADLETLFRIVKEKNLLLIEDCAQALGAAYRNKLTGTLGAGCFSFGEGKNLYAMGGGLVSTNDDRLAGELKKFRSLSRGANLTELIIKIAKTIAFRTLTLPSVFTVTAFPALYLTSFRNEKINTDEEHRLAAMPKSSFYSQFSNAQAALGLTQFENFQKRTQKRIDNARWLTDSIQGTPGITLPPAFTDRTHLYLHYAVKINDRENFVRRLIRLGVDAQRDYCSFCPELADFHTYSQNEDGDGVILRPAGPKDLPSNRDSSPPSASQNDRSVSNAKKLKNQIVYLPNHPSLGKNEILEIGHRVKKVLSP